MVNVFLIMGYDVSAEDFVLMAFIVSDAFLFLFLVGGLIISGRRPDSGGHTSVLDEVTELETFKPKATKQRRQLVITKDAVARFLAHGHLSGIMLILNLEYGELQFPPNIAVLPVLSYYTYNLYRSVTQDSHRKVLRRGVVNFIQLLAMQFLFMIKTPGSFMVDGRYTVAGLFIALGFVLDMGQQMDYLDTSSTRYKKCDVYALISPLDAWLTVSVICLFCVGLGMASTANAKHPEYFLILFVLYFGGVLVRTAVSAAIHLPGGNVGKKLKKTRDVFLGREVKSDKPTSPVIRHLWNALLSLMALLTAVMALLEGGHLIRRRDRNPALNIGVPLLITVGFTVIGVAYTSLTGEEPLEIKKWLKKKERKADNGDIPENDINYQYQPN